MVRGWGVSSSYVASLRQADRSVGTRSFFSLEIPGVVFLRRCARKKPMGTTPHRIKYDEMDSSHSTI